ncbi:hypothetical protein ACSBR2_011656 [Camellia fascicularis]
MLHKLFGIRKHKPPPSSSRCLVPAKPAATPAVEERSSVLKIIHAGGHVENYYMAIPANRITAKYPSFILARPDVFWRPWDAVVRPEEILVPGQKFFVVPRQTLKKLRKRIQKPGSGVRPTHSFLSQSSIDVSAEVVSHQKYDFSSKSFQQSNVGISSVATSKSNGKTGIRIRRVRFFGIDPKHDSDSISMDKKGGGFFGIDPKHDSDSISMDKKGGGEGNPKKGSESQHGGGKRRVRNMVTWNPTLTVIKETQGAND